MKYETYYESKRVLEINNNGTLDQSSLWKFAKIFVKIKNPLEYNLDIEVYDNTYDETIKQ